MFNKITYLALNVTFLISFTSAGPVIANKKVTNVVTDTVINISPSMPVEKYGHTNYYFEAIFSGNYYQATQFCNYHNMSLLSIETKEENDFLFKSLLNFVGDGVYNFWTSGTTLPDTHWIWMSTGKPVLYTSWASKQPDNFNKNEHCLEIKYSKSNKVLFWNDAPCTIGRHVICETLIPKSISELIATSSNCNLTLINVPVV